MIADEKNRLEQEYQTLCVIAKSVKCKKAEEVFYKICTEEKYYTNIKNCLHIALRYLAKTYNEGIVESFFNIINKVDEPSRPLSIETCDLISYIKANGPPPLAAKALVRHALDEHFNKNWHFCTDSDKFFISAVVQHQIESAKNEFTLFE